MRLRSDANVRPHCYAFSHADGDGDGDPHGGSACPHRNPDPDTHAYPNCNTCVDASGYPRSSVHCHTCSHSDAYPEADGDADRGAHTNAYPRSVGIA